MSHLDILGGDALGRGNSKCKGPEVGAYLPLLWKNQVSVAGLKRERESGDGVKEKREGLQIGSKANLMNLAFTLRWEPLILSRGGTWI